MALPVISSLQDCANYTTSLAPWTEQLRASAGTYLLEHYAKHGWEGLTNPAALKQLYVDTNPFISGLVFSITLFPPFLVASEINQNWSQIDRVWSILPTLYNLHWAVWTHMAGFATERMDLRFIVSLVWSMRLTFNYWRRGGYKIGSEDYRWAIIKEKIGQPAFFVLDVLFISSVQNVLLFLVTAPSYISLLVSRYDTANNRPAVGVLDYWFAGQIVYLVAQTFVADQQQWDYQTAKYKYRETAKLPANGEFTAEQLDRGFRTTGLWAYSRHPNFVSEQLVWWSFYLWASLNAGTFYNWTIIGPIIYTSVFLGSTPLTERITGEKYPEYKDYQRQVGMFFPKSASPPTFSQSPKAKRIQESPASARNAEDYAQAKKRYDLR